MTFAPLLRNRKREVTGARADVGDRLAGERSQAGDNLVRLLPFLAGGIFEARHEVVEAHLVHALIGRALRRRRSRALANEGNGE